MWFVWLIVLLAAYLLGSIPTAYLLVKLKKGIDIRSFGSGNVGTTNSLRAAGPSTGVLVLLIDMAKGAVPAYAAGLIGGPLMAAAAGAAAFIGHLCPLWLGFRGGKGVAVTIGVAVVITPWLALLTIGGWLLALLIGGYVSMASCCGAVLLPLLSLVTNQPYPYTLLYFVLGALVIIRHRSNYRNIRAGREEKMFAWQRRRGGKKK